MSLLAKSVAPLAALVLVGGVGVAHAAQTPLKPAKANVSVSIKLDKTQSSVGGRISSPKTVCKADRPVQLFQKTGGNPPHKVFTGTSNSDGTWGIKGPGGHIPAGKFHVVIPGTAKCKPATSATVTAAHG